MKLVFIDDSGTAIPVVFAAIFLVLFAACPGKTDEGRIQELLEEIGRSAERKDLNGLMNHLAGDYIDFEGRDGADTEEMVKEYFNRYRGIAVHMLGRRIEDLQPLMAVVQVDAVLSSGAAQAFRRFASFAGDYYRFTFELTKQDKIWKIRYAEWHDISVKELFPDSMPILKDLFPEAKSGR